MDDDDQYDDNILTFTSYHRFSFHLHNQMCHGIIYGGVLSQLGAFIINKFLKLVFLHINS